VARDRPVAELTDAELTTLIHAARKSGTVSLNRIIIERRIIDPQTPRRPLIEGDASDVG
jgi:hypothetical protein